MALRYLLDTNTASYIIKGSHAAVDRRLSEIPLDELAISAVTEGELHLGAARLPQATRLQALLREFFLRVTILPWDSQAAEQYGSLRASLERKGLPMGNLDLVIAAHALALDLILVTSDRAFERIKNLQTEDWTRNPHR